MKTNPDQRYQSAGMVRSDACEVMIELERPTKPADATAATEEGTNGRKSLPTILFIEHRLKQQDIIRDYLTKHGFRVLLFNNVHRAISRLHSNPPDCVVLIGDSIGDELVAAYDQVRELNRDRFINIAVLAERQAEFVEKLEQTALSRVMQQPITLRELRREIHLLFQRKMKTHGRPTLSS